MGLQWPQPNRMARFSRLHRHDWQLDAELGGDGSAHDRSQLLL